MRKSLFFGWPAGHLTLSLLVLFLCASSSRAQLFSSNDPALSTNRNPGSNSTVSARHLAIPRKAREIYAEGLQRLQQNDVAASLPFFEKAIKKYATFYEAYYHLGVAQARLGQDDRALTSFQSSINLSGGSYALAQFAYALLLCQKGQPVQAESIVRNGLDLGQHIQFGKIVLGAVLVKLHRFDEAAQNARDAIRVDPAAADAYLVLASVDDSHSDYAQEVRDLDTFLRLEPDGARHHQIRPIRDVAQHLAERNAAKNQNHLELNDLHP